MIVLNRLAIIILLVISNTLSGASYVIAPNGSNSNPGTLSTPWSTLSYAVAQASPGDSILIRGGTYSEGEIWIRGGDGMGGKDSRYLTLLAYQQETPRFTNGNRGLIIDAAYVRVNGLTFANGKEMYNVNWNGRSHHVELRNNKFIGTAGYAAIMLTGDYNLVENNLIQLDGNNLGTQGHAIYLQEGTHNTIRNNVISGMSGYGIHIYEEQRPEDPSGYERLIQDVIVENNTIYASKDRSGIMVGAGADMGPAKVQNITLRRNVIFNNAGSGIVVHGWSTIQNVHIHHNTLVNNDADAIDIGGNVDQVDIINNILVRAPGTRHIHLESGPSNIAADHNLYHPAPIKTDGITDPFSVTGSPHFTNPDQHDFSLTALSPAVDAGKDLGLPYSDKAPDLGAFEYGGTASVNVIDFRAVWIQPNVHLSWKAPGSGYGTFRLERRRGQEPSSVICSHLIKNDSFYHCVDNKIKPGVWNYRLSWLSPDGGIRTIDTIELEIPSPSMFSLSSNYPNPFNPETSIDYTMTVPRHVLLEIYDVRGRLIRTLVDQNVTAGNYTVTWDGNNQAGENMPGGLYLCRVQIGQTSFLRKMVLLN